MTMVVTVEYCYRGLVAGGILLSGAMVCGMCEGRVVFYGAVLGLRFSER